MQHLIVFTISFILSILLAYADSFAQTVMVLIWTGLFLIPVFNEKRKVDLYIIMGFLIGLFICSIYNSELFLNRISIHNKKYVKLNYVRNIGPTEIYISGNKLITFTGNWSKEEKQTDTRFVVSDALSTNYFDTNGLIFTSKLQPLFLSEGGLRYKIEEFKAKISQKLKSVAGDEEGALISSLILGVKDKVLKNKNDNLKSLGIIHILSISGFHVNLLESLLKKIRLKRFSALIIILYAVIVDSVPAYRACIMKVSSVFARVNKRDSSVLGDLAISALILLSMQPFLVFDLSFQLTYCSTLGMILFNEFISMKMTEIRFISPWIKKSIAGSLAALSMSLPFISMINSTISLSLIPANIFIVPIYTGICITSFLIILTMNISILSQGLILVFKILYRLSGIIEGLILYLFNFKFNVNIVMQLYFYLIAILICRLYKEIGYVRKYVYFLASMIFLFIVFNPPFVTKIKFEKNFGTAKVEISGFLKKGVFVNESMYKPGKRNDLTCIEEKIRFCDLLLEKTEYDFINVLDDDINLSQSLNNSKSDIINQEYIKVGNRLFKVR